MTRKFSPIVAAALQAAETTLLAAKPELAAVDAGIRATVKAVKAARRKAKAKKKAKAKTQAKASAPK